MGSVKTIHIWMKASTVLFIIYVSSVRHILIFMTWNHADGFGRNLYSYYILVHYISFLSHRNYAYWNLQTVSCLFSFTLTHVRANLLHSWWLIGFPGVEWFWAMTDRSRISVPLKRRPSLWATMVFKWRAIKMCDSKCHVHLFDYNQDKL